MPNYNKIIIIGHLTSDPELRTIPSGTSVCECGIAYSKKIKDSERTMFVDFTVWARRGEIFAEYCQKGQPILIEGELEMDQWTTPEGHKRTKHKINVDDFKFLGDGGGSRKPRSKPKPEQQPSDNTFDSGGDDIPF